jgi:hypothetical protein
MLGENHASGGIGTFEVLETLVLGIRGKLALWQVLPIAREVDPRIPNLDFEKLAASAEEQGARVEKRRLQGPLRPLRPRISRGVFQTRKRIPSLRLPSPGITVLNHRYKSGDPFHAER